MTPQSCLCWPQLMTELLHILGSYLVQSDWPSCVSKGLLVASHVAFTVLPKPQCSVSSI